MRKNDSQRNMAEICAKALRKAVPSEKERRRTEAFCQDIRRKLQNAIGIAGIKGEVQIEGSVAKDTWLAGEKDIDVFILLPKTYRREDFPRVLDIAKEMAGNDFLEAYAEHPYIEARMGGFIVDFVPCYGIERADEAASSVDRTPLHTIYVRARLSNEKREETRLLKLFMRGIGTYGAEIKIGGFNGYLCELLILHYGSFSKLLEAASDWRKGTLVDIKRYYEGKEGEARKIFQEPLLVIDPVDRGRNVASAVRIDKLNLFIAASREFLKNPKFVFFYPKKSRSFSSNEIISMMNMRGTTFVFLKTGGVKAVPDVLWGQLYKSQKILRSLAERHGFITASEGVYSDEKNVNVLVLEFYSRFLSALEKHLGPQTEKRSDCGKFLEKHLGSQNLISGPRIENDRWVIDRKRAYTDVVDLLKDKLRNGGCQIGIASLVSRAFSCELEIWLDNEVKEFYSANPDFASFLTEHLKGRPRWLQ